MRTAAKTEMTLVTSVRSFSSLQDRCRAAVARHLANPSRTGIDALPLPAQLKQYVADVVVDALARDSFRAVDHPARCRPPAGRRPTRVALKFWPPSDANYWPKAGWLDDCVRIST